MAVALKQFRKRSIAEPAPQRVILAGFVQLHVLVKLLSPPGRKPLVAHGTSQRKLTAVG